MINNVKFHHYGLAVKSFDDAETFHKNIGYTINDEVYDGEQNVMLKLCTSPEFPNVELVKPNDSSSPINGYLKSANEIIYHVCYEIDIRKKTIEDIFQTISLFVLANQNQPSYLVGGMFHFTI